MISREEYEALPVFDYKNAVIGQVVYYASSQSEPIEQFTVSLIMNGLAGVKTGGHDCWPHSLPYTFNKLSLWQQFGPRFKTGTISVSKAMKNFLLDDNRVILELALK